MADVVLVRARSLLFSPHFCCVDLPALQIAEQLVVYQQNLKQKLKQLRAMELELEMYKGQVGESKREIERTEGQLDALQKQFVKKVMSASAGGGVGGSSAGAVDEDTAVLYNY